MSYFQLAYLHLGTIFPAFLIGTYLLVSRKGTPRHKLLGRVYMLLMLFTAIVTLFMSARVGPTIMGHFGFIHLLGFVVFYSVPAAYFAARRGDIKTHRSNIIGLYVGGILAWIIQKATSKNWRNALYTVPYHFSGTFFKTAVCLFDARRKSGVTSQPILLGTWRATFLRRWADLFSQISSGRRILMNNPG